MDVNDLQFRIRRLYSAIAELEDLDTEGKTNLYSLQNEVVSGVAITFGNLSQEQLTNKIVNVLGLLFGLKDHLKEELRARGGNPQEVEDLFNNVSALSIIADIHNSEKHGYPAKKHERSGKQPKISKLFEAFSGGNGYIQVDSVSGALKAKGHTSIVICGEIVDRNEKPIAALEDIIEEAITAVEEFVRNEGLIYV